MHELFHHRSPIPWRYNATTTELRSSGRTGAEHHYPTMDNAEIAALQVASVAADQAHLYLWVTNPRLIADRKTKDWLDIVEGVSSHQNHALGQSREGRVLVNFQSQTRHVIFGVRGLLGYHSAARADGDIR